MENVGDAPHEGLLKSKGGGLGVLGVQGFRVLGSGFKGLRV